MAYSIAVPLITKDQPGSLKRVMGQSRVLVAHSGKQGSKMVPRPYFVIVGRWLGCTFSVSVKKASVVKKND